MSVNFGTIVEQVHVADGLLGSSCHIDQETNLIETVSSYVCAYIVNGNVNLTIPQAHIQMWMKICDEVRAAVEAHRCYITGDPSQLTVQYTS